MADPVAAFAGRLFGAVPTLRREWETYVESHQNYAAEGLDPPNFGVFLLILAEQSEEWFRSREPERATRLQTLLGFFESEFGADADIDELIETGFAAYLPEPGDVSVAMLELLGPKLRAARERQLAGDDAAVPASTVAFLHRLAVEVPALRARVAGHFERLHGRPLPHVFVGEIVFEAVELVASGRAQVVRPLLGFLEAEYGVDEDIDNVIDVSFVEMLPNPGERGSEIEQLLGPKLRAELQRQRNWSELPPEGRG